MFPRSMRRGWRPVALAGVVALSLAACGDNSSGGGSNSDTLTIGASLPLTGDFSEPGGAAKQGYQVWASMVNANGGLLGKQVTLTYDQQCTDRYGRLLAYVKIDGQEVNTVLVERGYACVLHIPPNGDDRVDEFDMLEYRAKLEGRGLWAACPPPLPCSRRAR